MNKLGSRQNSSRKIGPLVNVRCRALGIRTVFRHVGLVLSDAKTSNRRPPEACAESAERHDSIRATMWAPVQFNATPHQGALTATNPEPPARAWALAQFNPTTSAFNRQRSHAYADVNANATIRLLPRSSDDFNLQPPAPMWAPANFNPNAGSSRAWSLTSIACTRA